MMLRPQLRALLLVVLFAAPSAPVSAATNEESALAFFEKKVRPLLADNCYNCHSADTNAQSGLRLDDRNGILTGGKRGPALLPGQPEKSLLLRAVRYTDKALRMPPKKQLTAEQVADLEKWIKAGAAWPVPRLPASLGKSKAKFDKLRKEHWAWQPLRSSKVPAVRDVSWPHSDVDRFILRRLEHKGLRPVRDAGKADLLRRVTFDLVGLPPSPEEIDAFVRDHSPDAFEKVVDRLLASPAYGERWGRHWLDVARYGESTGSARNLPYPHAWRYRDYVIDAFNKDKPYDRFITEQIAGDLLPGCSQEQLDEQVIATGFLALGVKDVNQRFKVRFIMDNIDEQIDTVSRAVLGLTASCARCHDHKFDPIPTTDYYALAGIFHSTDLCAGLRNKMGGGGLDYYDTQMLLGVGPKKGPDPEAPKKIEQTKNLLALARKEAADLAGKPEGQVKDSNGRTKHSLAQQKVAQLQNDLFKLTDPASNGPVALGVREGKAIGPTQIRIRGEAEKLGPVVPRGFLSVLNVPDAPKVPDKQSGRLQLARWLVSEKNPLSQRVIVNRIWQHLFGQGVVSSVDNFGTTGDAPSHPELLDHLAARFVRDGGSVKKMIRYLVLSRSYQLGAEATAENQTVDPGNRLVWRRSPRRLEAEEIRDAMLAVSGNLDRARRVGSAAKDLKVIEMPNNGTEARRVIQSADASNHRGVYLPLVRTLTPLGLEVFDFADQGMVNGKRDSTTVPTQALYLLNDPFVLRQSKGLAQRVLSAAPNDSGRITLAYRLALGRKPTGREIDRVKSYLLDYRPPGGKVNPAAAWSSFCQALLASAEFRYLK